MNLDESHTKKRMTLRPREATEECCYTLIEAALIAIHSFVHLPFLYPLCFDLFVVLIVFVDVL